jgi:hypothetical protein
VKDSTKLKCEEETIRMNVKNKNKSKDIPSLALRIAAGLYLLYTDYSLLTGWNSIQESHRIVIVIAIITFAAAGIFLIGSSVANLFKLRKKHKE